MKWENRNTNGYNLDSLIEGTKNETECMEKCVSKIECKAVVFQKLN